MDSYLLPPTHLTTNMETVKTTTAKNDKVIVATPGFAEQTAKVVPIEPAAPIDVFASKIEVIKQGQVLLKQLRHFESLAEQLLEANGRLEEKPDYMEISIEDSSTHKTYFVTRQEPLIKELLDFLDARVSCKVIDIKSQITAINF